MAKTRVLHGETITLGAVPYQEGTDAFRNHELPSRNPYINVYGDNSEAIVSWNMGWSDEAKKLFGKSWKV